LIHLFDIDYTVIRKSTTWYFLCEALGRKAIAFSQISGLPFEWLRYTLGRANQDFIEEAVTHLAGLDQSLLETIAEDCFTRRLKRNIYTGAASLIGELKSRGEQVYFASSSLHTLIKPLERFFGITESIASDLEFAEGKTTGRLTGGGVFGAKKKTAVEAWLAQRAIGPENVRFYSDSYTDLPLLEYCGQPVAVNPDRILAKEAGRRGWEILRFRETLGGGVAR
jgi:HAD superfamily hydrolase (TIGR01490 family)